MNNASFFGTLNPSSTPLTFFAAQVPAGFPSPALDHMEHKLSLDTLLDIQAPHITIEKLYRIASELACDPSSLLPHPSEL